MSTKKITEYVSTVSVATGISRILGYLRDMLVAYAFGAGIFADAFYAAFRIPNLFRRLLGEGSVSAAFIPVFTEYLETKTKNETQKLLNVVFTFLITILLTITLLGIVIAKPLTTIIAFGFVENPQKLQLAVDLTRIMFPYLMFACLAALMLGVLNSLKSFFLPAVSPAFLSISEIVYILVIVSIFSLPENSQIYGLAISVVIGGFLHYFIQQINLLRHQKFSIKFQYDFTHSGLKKILLLLTPTMIGFSVDQVNAFVDTVCASLLQEGSITALYYSNRLMQLPLALFGIAIATVSLPMMSAASAKNDIVELKNTFNYSIRLILFCLLPATVGLIIFGLPIVRLLFERGKFTPTASQMTYQALAFYSLGLIAYSIVKVTASAFYSFKETKIPVKTATLCMLINVILNIILMKPLGVGGLALATAISSFLNSFLLIYYLRRRIGLLGVRKIFHSGKRILFASILMGLSVYVLSIIEYPLIPSLQIIKVAFCILSGIIVYFLFAKLLNIEERKPVFELLKEKTAITIE
ncbi:MAG: murein biosynthesis integral membrane protein MurJ [Elusimicrobiota bacterium]|nr:murein biosynthesis integral membrane protein MurJ [Elusimicrobiota bacterium]